MGATAALINGGVAAASVARKAHAEGFGTGYPPTSAAMPLPDAAGLGPLARPAIDRGPGPSCRRDPRRRAGPGRLARGDGRGPWRAGPQLADAYLRDPGRDITGDARPLQGGPALRRGARPRACRGKTGGGQSRLPRNTPAGGSSPEVGKLEDGGALGREFGKRLGPGETKVINSGGQNCPGGEVGRHEICTRRAGGIGGEAR
mmetsp:Transcript_21170/g.56763  ORF Transcript_21170/g.56763 Transcript_21170/m.56763 type:complete len:203 (-) Transcript_21170:1021-1629(-)